MRLDRRQLLTGAGACLVSCTTTGAPPKRPATNRLDELLAAHEGALPERAGAGANHYPMAAEALAALGYEEAIDEAWIEGAALYAGTLGRATPIESDADVAGALGDYERFGDWLDYFGTALSRGPWRTVLAHWAPRLAPAIAAAVYHGVIRTGHATRALRQRDTPERRNELAAGLAYWAARYVELPTRSNAPAANESFGETLANLAHPYEGVHEDVDFFAVLDRLTERPLAPRVLLEPGTTSPRAELQETVREAATAFLEMLVAERNRLWLLHTVTGPAAVEWILPELEEPGARQLVRYARQSVVAMYAAYGEPFSPRRHMRASSPDWPEQIERVVASRSVHGIKLFDALLRFDRADDPLWRSVAAQWFEWT